MANVIKECESCGVDITPVLARFISDGIGFIVVCPLCLSQIQYGNLHGEANEIL